MGHILRWAVTQLPSTNIADVWIGIAGLAFTMLISALALAYRMGRQTEALSDLKQQHARDTADLKEDISAIEKRVETFLLRVWMDQDRRAPPGG